MSLLTTNDFVKTKGGLLTRPSISKETVILRDDSGLALYAAIGVTGTSERPIYVGPDYFSAKSAEHAKREAGQFWTRRHPGFSFFILAGPAIGFFVHDNHGDVLSTGGERKDLANHELKK